MKIELIDDLAFVGQTIEAAIWEAMKRAAANKTEVRFDFNGCEMRVRHGSNPDALNRDFMRSMRGYHDDPVGPFPPHELSDEVKARDAEIEAENERRRQKAAEEYAAKQRAKRDACESEIEGVEMFVRDDEAWVTWKDNNQDGYGSACVSYAERWARLMQARMTGGTLLAQVAEQASHDADVEGITGFMYGAAVSMLAQVWEHGEALRMWHNLHTQIGTEGEKANESDGAVLNPALLNIG